MIFKKLYLIILVYFIIFSIKIFAKTDSSSDYIKEENLSNYINLDPSEDLFSGYQIKGYRISKDYVKNLIWHQDIKFYVDMIDQYNLRQNINILPRFPYVFMIYGGYNYNRGFDFGALFRNDNIANSRVAFTTALSYEQRRRFWLHTNVEYPALLNDRMKLLATFSFFNSGAQYASQINRYYNFENYDTQIAGKSINLIRMIDGIWQKLNIDRFYNQNETGFHFITGYDYRIPFIEANIVNVYELAYKYDDSVIIGTIPNDPSSSSPNYLPVEQKLSRVNLGMNIGLELHWDKFKQSPTIPVGNNLSLATKFYLPTGIGYPYNEFRFKSKVEEKFNYKVFKEFAVKFRLLISANYKLSLDYSGDPFVRGLGSQELTGWFATIGNLEAYIPLVDVTMFKGLDRQFKRNADFIVYLLLFVDGGFTIENYDYPLENVIVRSQRDHLKNSPKGLSDPLGQYYLGSSNYLLPAFTAGAGLQIYPFFLHFMLRFDVGVNVLKAIFYYDDYLKNRFSPAECVEFILSFNQMF